MQPYLTSHHPQPPLLTSYQHRPPLLPTQYYQPQLVTPYHQQSQILASQYQQPQILTSQYQQSQLLAPQYHQPQLLASQYHQPKLLSSQYHQPHLLSSQYHQPHLLSSQYHHPQHMTSQFQPQQILTSQYQQPQPLSSQYETQPLPSQLMTSSSKPYPELSSQQPQTLPFYLAPLQSLPFTPSKYPLYTDPQPFQQNFNRLAPISPTQLQSVALPSRLQEGPHHKVLPQTETLPLLEPLTEVDAQQSQANQRPMRKLEESRLHSDPRFQHDEIGEVVQPVDLRVTKKSSQTHRIVRPLPRCPTPYYRNTGETLPISHTPRTSKHQQPAIPFISSPVYSDSTDAEVLSPVYSDSVDVNSNFFEFRKQTRLCVTDRCNCKRIFNEESEDDY